MKENTSREAKILACTVALNRIAKRRAAGEENSPVMAKMFRVAVDRILSRAALDGDAIREARAASGIDDPYPTFAG